MTRTELFEGIARYWDEVYDIDEFVKRAIEFMHNIKYKPKIKQPSFRALWDLRKTVFRVFMFYTFEAGKKHRKAFYRILRAAKTKLAYMMPKIIYIYTYFLIDIKRSGYDAMIALEHAQWEKENTSEILVEPSVIPVSDNIRRNALDLTSTAYSLVRDKTSNKEILYQTVVSAMLDFNDRFGETIETFDDYYREQMISTCERIINQTEDASPDNAEPIPENPPPGFTREILDALDNAVRYRKLIADS
jgi:hypothetical protein